MNSTRQGFLNGVFAANQFTQPILGVEGNEQVSGFQQPCFLSNRRGALLKNTKIFERLNFQLRFEGYNVFNQVNLRDITSDLANRISGVRRQQFNPRNFQIGAKLTF